MKVKLQVIWNSQQTLPKLLNRELPAKVAYWIGKNANKIEIELRSIDKVRQDLIKKYGKEDEVTKTWNVTDGREEFNKDFNELMETETDINIGQFSLKDLGDIKLTGAEVSAIEFMLKEE